MEKTYNPALIQRTQRYMETHSISQNQFAAKVNLSSAALSSYLNQKYKGSVEAVERQLSEFFKLDEEAEAAAEKTASLLPRAAYVPTSISEDVCQSIRFAQLEHCMVVLHGDAGVGKSKGAQKFLHDHPTNAVGISITPSTGTLNGSIKLLARALRVPECRNKMDQMMALRSRLDGTNWVIVIDEAQHLKYAALEEIRSLTDDNPMTGEHGVGVVLIGNSEVYLEQQGYSLSVSSVCRYAQGYVENLQTLQIAQANFRNMLDELERYPDLDTTEALVRVASQNLMTALTSKKDEDWSAVSVDKLMNQISGLTRAVAYKKRVELQNKSDIEAGTGDLKSALWSAMAKERPDLYKQVSAYLDRKAQEGGT